MEKRTQVVAQTDYYSRIASDSADKGTSQLPYIVLADNPTTNEQIRRQVIHQTLSRNGLNPNSVRQSKRMLQPKREREREVNSTGRRDKQEKIRVLTVSLIIVTTPNGRTPTMSDGEPRSAMMSNRVIRLSTVLAFLQRFAHSIEALKTRFTSHTNVSYSLEILDDYSFICFITDFAFLF